MSTNTRPIWFSSDDAAQYLGISPQTLNNWRATKRHVIAFTRIGKLCRYRQEDLDKWLASRTEQAELVPA